VRWDNVGGDRTLTIDLPPALMDLSRFQYLRFDVAVSYLDTRNEGLPKTFQVGIRDQNLTVMRPLSNFGPQTLEGVASAASPAAVPFPLANIQIPTLATTSQDLTTTTFRTYRIGLRELCADGLQFDDARSIVLDFGGTEPGNLSASILLDHFAFERAADDPDAPACDGTSVGGDGDGDGDGGGTTETGNGTTETGNGSDGPGGGNGCNCEVGNFDEPSGAHLLLLVGVILVFSQRQKRYRC
jgi:hypothetical protein